MRNLRNLMLLITAFVVGQTAAQEKTNSQNSQMQRPTSGSERDKLQFLVGSFATETKMPSAPSAPKGATGKGTSVISWALDSMFLFIDEQSMNSLFGRYKGHGVLGYDPQNHQFVLSMFNNFGDRPSYKGNFVGDTLVLETKVPMPGRSFDQKLLWYKEGSAVKFRVLNDLGKGFLPVIEQTSMPISQRTKQD